MTTRALSRLAICDALERRHNERIYFHKARQYPEAYHRFREWRLAWYREIQRQRYIIYKELGVALPSDVEKFVDHTAVARYYDTGRKS